MSTALVPEEVEPIAVRRMRLEAQAINRVTYLYRRSTKERKVVYDRALQTHLLRVRDCRGYCDAGFDSMTDWLEKEFPQSRRYYERVMKNADFHRQLYGQYWVASLHKKRGIEKLEEVVQIEEGVTRYITCLPECAWVEVWEDAKRLALEVNYNGKAAKYHSNKVTGKIAALAAKDWQERQRGGRVEIVGPNGPSVIPTVGSSRFYPLAMREKLDSLLDTDNHLYICHIINLAKSRLSSLGKEDYQISAADFPDDNEGID